MIRYFYTLLLFLSIKLSCFSQSANEVNYDLTNDHEFSYKEISGGFTYSSFSHYHDRPQATANGYNVTFGSSGISSSNAYSYTYPKPYTHNVLHIGGSFSYYSNRDEHFRLYYRTFFSLGKDNDNDPRHLDNENHSSFINVGEITWIGGIDYAWVGLESGLHLGINRTADEKTGDQDGSLSTGEKDLIPQFGGRLRLGYPENIFFQVQLGTPYMGLNGSKYPYTFGIGTGLGKDNGNVIRLGLGLAAQGSLVFAAGMKVKLQDNYGFETELCFGTLPM